MDVVILEIIEVIENVQSMTSSLGFDDFRKSWPIRMAAQRGVEVISEAVRHIPASLLDQNPEINWRDIRAIGNVLRHEYHKVHDEVIWFAVQNELPALLVTMRTMLDSLDRK